MKENVLLISEATLKSVGLINDNVDPAYLVPAMVIALEIGLQELLGTKLLKTIKEMVRDETIDGDYKTLLDDYCIPYLVWQTQVEILIPISFKTANSGSVQNTDEHKQANSLKDIEYLKEYYQDKARFFAKMLTDYLLVNRTKFPEWPGSFKDGIVGLTENYSGVYFKDYIYDKRHYRYDDKNYPCY